MASPVLVTGGTGRLGKLVVARLQDSGCDVRVLARHDRSIPPGVTFFAADLRSGQGIEPAVTGAAAIIHCATSTKGDAEATRNLVAAASRTGSAHLVYVSIVGIDHIASWGDPKTKLQAEQIVAGSMPWPVRRSAGKNVTPCGAGRSCRASTRTSQPLSCSRATTSVPRRPVPPVTMTGEAMGSPYASQPSTKG